MLALFSCTKEVSITPYLSKDQIAAARKMDLLTYLRCFEPQELVHVGGNTYVDNAPAGHGLIKVGGAIVPFANELPKNTELYRLMTTKPGED